MIEFNASNPKTILTIALAIFAGIGFIALGGASLVVWLILGVVLYLIITAAGARIWDNMSGRKR